MKHPLSSPTLLTLCIFVALAAIFVVCAHDLAAYAQVAGPTVPSAADVVTAPAGSSPAQRLTYDVIQILSTGVALALAALVARAVNFIATRYKVSIPAAWLTGTNEIIDRAISYANEKARQATVDSKTLASNDKLGIAAAFVLEHTTDAKLIALGEEKIKQLIEARLNSQRMAVNLMGGNSVPGVAKLLVLMLVTGLALSQSACGAANCAKTPNSIVCLAKTQLVDCTVATVKSSVSRLKPLALSLVAHVTGSDGVVDWSQLKPAFTSLGLEEGGCLLAAVAAQLQTPRGAAIAPEVVRVSTTYNAGWESFRNEKWPGINFKLDDGAAH